MRPGDGDGGFTDAGDEFVAEIIPLRRRAYERGEPAASPDEPEAGQPAPDRPTIAERSVWEQPTVELRRREAHPEPTPHAAASDGPTVIDGRSLPHRR